MPFRDGILLCVAGGMIWHLNDPVHEHLLRSQLVRQTLSREYSGGRRSTAVCGGNIESGPD